MKACVLEKIGSLQYQDVPTPTPSEGEVLLHIKACGICSSDVDRVFRTGTYHFPTIPGHEFSGEIVALGANVSAEYLGKRAAVFPLQPCFSCPSCDEKSYARCENYGYFGSRNDGGFAEYLAVPLWNLVLFSEKLSFETAALCEPTAVALHALKQGGPCEGKTVAILGNGTIGLLCAMWAKTKGAKDIFIVGRSAKKVDFAKKLGFQHSISSVSDDVSAYIKSHTQAKGADLVIEMVGSETALGESILCCKKGGTLVVTGNPHGDMCLTRDIYWKVLRHELTVKGTWNSSYHQEENDWKESIQAMESGEIQAEKLISHEFSLKDHEKAFETMKNPEEMVVKIVLKPE